MINSPVVIRHRDKKITKEVCGPRDRIIKLGGYPYTLHLFQAIFPQDPKLISYMTRKVIGHKKFNAKFDYVFALAQKSISFATVISQKTKKPLLVAYSRRYDKPNKEMRDTEIQIIEPKKYSDPFILYSYFLHKGDRVTVVSDDMNWGDASISVARAFLKRGIKIANYVIGVEKYDRKGVQRLISFLKRASQTRVPIHFCTSVIIREGRMLPIDLSK